MPEEETTETEEPKRDAWQGLDPGPVRTAGSPVERGIAVDPRTGNPIADPDNPKSAFDQRDWGSLFEIFFFDGIKNFIKTQNPPVAFSWNSEMPLVHGTILDLPSDKVSANSGVSYAPTGLVLNVGILDPGPAPPSSVLADLVTMHDGNVYHINEVNAAPGQDFELTFTNVSCFDRLAVFAYYMGSATHAIRIQLWNYNTAAWVTFHTLKNGIDFEQHFKVVPDDTDFIQNKIVQMRFYHTEGGSPAHDLFIDYVALSQSLASSVSYNKLDVGGFVPELHGYMSGLSTAIYAPLSTGAGIGFRVYKNGNPTHCVLYVTDDNNGPNGLVWSDRFNVNPFYTVSNEGTPAGVHDFLANDRIIIVAEDPEQPPAGMGAGIVNKTMATDIHRLDFWWHFSYEKLLGQLLREILSYPSEEGEFTGIPPGGVGPGDPADAPAGDPGIPPGGDGSGSGEGEGSGSEPDIPT